MRETKQVNVLLHEVNAARGRNGHRTPLQEIERDAEQRHELDVRSLLSGGVTLAVRTSSGEPAVLRVPHSILAVLVTITLALIAGGFWLVSSITEMKTNLVTIQEAQRDIKREQSSNLKLMIAYATNETGRIQFITALLSPDKREELYKYDAANPRPRLPESNDSEDK